MRKLCKKNVTVRFTYITLKHFYYLKLAKHFMCTKKLTNTNDGHHVKMNSCTELAWKLFHVLIPNSRRLASMRTERGTNMFIY